MVFLMTEFGYKDTNFFFVGKKNLKNDTQKAAKMRPKRPSETLVATRYSPYINLNINLLN